MFGPDNVAIQRVRLIVVLTSIMLFLVLFHDSEKYDSVFNPATKIATKIEQVIKFLKIPSSTLCPASEL